jgi:glyoxylase-like metal-dependent hydrolase (beta-lactamase superfamily II)
MSHDRLTKRSFLTGSLCACCACAATQAFSATSPASIGTFGSEGLPTLLELGTDTMTRIAQTVWVARIAPHLWLHTTTGVMSGFVFPANGLILEQDGGALLIDAGYTPDQAETLVLWSKKNLSSPVALAVATHFHNDRTGGIDGLKKYGVRTLANPLTCQLASEHQMPVPEPITDFGTEPYRLDKACELLFPGAGHTRDNIVAWLPQQRVLFGGCLLKSGTSGGLGNIADSVIPDWAATVRNVQTHYPLPNIAIPGHGTTRGDPAAWTLSLLPRAQSPHA